MPYINQEKIIGWYNSETDCFLCNECSAEEKDIEENDYEPILEDEMRSEDLYICDECKEKFFGSN